MWFSGLRGAIAFALAIDSLKRFNHGHIILTMTLIYAVITILIVGGCIKPLLAYFKVINKEEAPKSDIMPVYTTNDNCFKKLKRILYFIDGTYLYPWLTRPKIEETIRSPKFAAAQEYEEAPGISMRTGNNLGDASEENRY